MRYSDELTVAGRVFRIEASSVAPAAGASGAAPSLEMSVRSADSGAGPVEVCALLPADPE